VNSSLPNQHELIDYLIVMAFCGADAVGFTMHFVRIWNEPARREMQCEVSKFKATFTFTETVHGCEGANCE
jgi:hypothetical protein